MESIGHPPARVEVIGGDYIEHRFGTWQKALRSFYAGKMTEVKNPPLFEDRRIVRTLYDAEKARRGRCKRQRTIIMDAVRTERIRT